MDALWCSRSHRGLSRHTNESCLTHERIMSHTWMSHDVPEATASWGDSFLLDPNLARLFSEKWPQNVSAVSSLQLVATHKIFSLSLTLALALALSLGLSRALSRMLSRALSGVLYHMHSHFGQSKQSASASDNALRHMIQHPIQHTAQRAREHTRQRAREHAKMRAREPKIVRERARQQESSLCLCVSLRHTICYILCLPLLVRDNRMRHVMHANWVVSRICNEAPHACDWDFRHAGTESRLTYECVMSHMWIASSHTSRLLWCPELRIEIHIYINMCIHVYVYHTYTWQHDAMGVIDLCQHMTHVHNACHAYTPCTATHIHDACHTHTWRMPHTSCLRDRKWMISY